MEPAEEYVLDDFRDKVMEALRIEVREHATFVVNHAESFNVDRFMTKNADEYLLTATFEFDLYNPDLGPGTEPVGVATGKASAFVGTGDDDEVSDATIDELSIDVLTPHYDYNIFTSETPTSDERRVLACFGGIEVVAVDIADGGGQHVFQPASLVAVSSAERVDRQAGRYGGGFGRLTAFRSARVCRSRITAACPRCPADSNCSASSR